MKMLAYKEFFVLHIESIITWCGEGTYVHGIEMSVFIRWVSVCRCALCIV